MKSSLKILILMILGFYTTYSNPDISNIEDIMKYFDGCFSNEVKHKIKESGTNIWNEEFIKINSDSGYICTDYVSLLLEQKDKLNIYFDSIGISDQNLKWAVISSAYLYHVRGNEFKLAIDSVANLIWEFDSLCAINATRDTIDGNYIPYNVYDCCVFLMSTLDTATIIKIRNYKNDEEAAINEHFGLGYTLRNIFRLWGCSRFHYYFTGLKITNADHMSSIIIRALYGSLKKQDINLRNLIYTYRR